MLSCDHQCWPQHILTKTRSIITMQLNWIILRLYSWSGSTLSLFDQGVMIWQKIIHVIISTMLTWKHLHVYYYTLVNNYHFKWDFFLYFATRTKNKTKQSSKFNPCCMQKTWSLMIKKLRLGVAERSSAINGITSVQNLPRGILPYNA